MITETLSAIDRLDTSKLLHLTVIRGKLPNYVYDTVTESDLDEYADFKQFKTVIVGTKNDEIVGLVAYGEFINTDNGKTYPRFLHIIITPKFKRTRDAYNMLKESEKVFKAEGHETILCLITHTLPSRDMKKKYAEKFGYKKYAENALGEYFFKKI